MFRGMIRGHIRGLIRSAFAAIGSALPPFFKDAIQWCFSKGGELFQDINGLWWWKDLRGDQLRDVHLGALINLNGSDNCLSFDVGATSSTHFGECTFTIDIETGSDVSTTQAIWGLGNDANLLILLNEQLHINNQASTGFFLTANSRYKISVDYRVDGYVLEVRVDDVLVFDLLTSANSGFSNVLSVGCRNEIQLFAGIKVNSFEITGLNGFRPNFEEQPAGSLDPIMLDTSGVGLVPNNIDGLINGTIDANTRQRSIEVPSDQNLIGYTQDGLTAVPVLNTPENLALPFAQQKDVNGDPLQKFGQARKDIQSINSFIAVTDGLHTIQSVNFNGLSIVGFGGTATPSLTVDTISWTAGTIFHLELSDGTFIPFQTGEGLEIFDTVHRIQYFINGSSAGLWSTSDTQTPRNQLNGCDLWELDASPGTFKRVPYDQNGVPILTDGDLLLGYTWVSTHKGSAEYVNVNAETQGLNLPAPELWQHEQQFSTELEFSGLNPIEFDFGDIEVNREGLNSSYSDRSEPDRVKNFIKYKTPRTEEENEKVLDFENVQYIEVDGEFVLVEGKKIYNNNP